MAKSLCHWLLVLGLLLRFIEPLVENPMDYLYSDMIRHWHNGQLLWTINPGYYTSAIDPLGFQLFLSILQYVTQSNRWLVGGAFGMLSVLFVWFFYRAARELGLDKSTARLFSLILTYTPSLFTVFHLFLSETLTLTMLGLGFWMTARSFRKKTLASYLIAIIVWMMTIQAKASVAPIAAVSFLYLLFDNHAQFRIRLIAIIFIPILSLLPNTIREERLMNFFAPLGLSWPNTLLLESKCSVIRINWGTEHRHFKSPSMFDQPFWPISNWMTARHEPETFFEITIDPKAGKRDWTLAQSTLHYSWEDSLIDRRDNAIFLLFGPAWPESKFDSIEGELNYSYRWMWAPLIGYTMLGNLALFRRGLFLYFPVVSTAFFLFLLFQNVTIMEGRYRKPLEPLLILNAAWIVSNRSRNAKQG